MIHWKKISIVVLCLLLAAGCGQKDGQQTVPETFDTVMTPAVAPTELPTSIPAPEYNNYLFVYFTGNGKGQESIFFSVSQDGFTWKELNLKQPVLKSELGTTGVRDPFIIRSAEGDKYYLIATDLCIAKDGDWWKAQSKGSTAIMIWESEDLVNWSEQRMAEVNLSTAGCTWAPEAYYNEELGEYMVFWASRTMGDNYAKQRIFYVTTPDFVEFSKPQVWIDYPYSVIDVTIIEEDGVFYRFLKYEDESRIILERADSLLGEWTQIDSESLDAQAGVEGPACFRLHPEDVVDNQNFALLLDNYGGSGYYMLMAENLQSGEFVKKKGYSLPSKKPRHGTVIAITEEEYHTLLEKY